MYELINADTIFINTVSDLMTKWGIDYSSCTKKQVDDTIKLCAKEFNPCWEELLRFVYMSENDNKKFQTISIIRKNLSYIQ